MERTRHDLWMPESRHPLDHLVRSLLRERHEQHPSGGNDTGCDRVCSAATYDSRLAGPRAGQDHDRSARCFNGLALRRIEFVHCRTVSVTAVPPVWHDAHPMKLIVHATLLGLVAGCAGAPPQPSATPATAPPMRPDTLSYDITGEFQDANVLPLYRWDQAYYDPDKRGWVIYFTADPQSMSHYIELITWPSAEEITFKNGDASTFVTGTPGSDDGCTFTTARNDATGTTGSVECTSAHVHDDKSGRFLNVTFRARWAADA